MANPLKSIFANGMSLFKRDTVESVVGIDIGTSAIKVVQLRRKGGKAVLETYGTLALGPYAKGDVGQVTNLSAEDLAKAMTDTLRESNVTSSNCAIAIPA